MDLIASDRPGPGCRLIEDDGKGTGLTLTVAGAAVDVVADNGETRIDFFAAHRWAFNEGDGVVL